MADTGQRKGSTLKKQKGAAGRLAATAHLAQGRLCPRTLSKGKTFLGFIKILSARKASRLNENKSYRHFHGLS